MIKHLRNNKGDANVSKMTLIAIVFVVGAILLVLTTSAFKNPINRWFEKVSNDWFASENGSFTLNDTAEWSDYEQYNNKVYKTLNYIITYPDGTYDLLIVDKEHIENDKPIHYSWQGYNADGTKSGEEYTMRNGLLTISSDGKTIDADGVLYTAQLPQ